MLSFIYHEVTQWYSSQKRGRINAPFFSCICQFANNELVPYYSLVVTISFFQYYHELMGLNKFGEVLCCC